MACAGGRSNYALTGIPKGGVREPTSVIASSRRQSGSATHDVQTQSDTVAYNLTNFDYTQRSYAHAHRSTLVKFEAAWPLLTDENARCKESRRHRGFARMCPQTLTGGCSHAVGHTK